MATIYETQKADYKNALFYYQMAMEMGFPDAIERMAEAHLGDELGFERDEKTALKLFKRAANLGNAAAQYNLGMAYAWRVLRRDRRQKNGASLAEKERQGRKPVGVPASGTLLLLHRQNRCGL